MALILELIVGLLIKSPKKLLLLHLMGRFTYSVLEVTLL